MGLSGTNIDLAILKNRTVNESYGEFSEPGFPHINNFAPPPKKKKTRERSPGPQDLNMGCIDASRRQLQSVPKIRV
jgi:hypothetical protein